MDDRSLQYAALRLQSYRSLASVALLLLLLPSIWYLRTDLALYGTGSAALWLRFGARSTLIAAAAGGLVAIRPPVSFDGYSRAVAAAAWGIVVGLLALNALRPPGAGLPLRSPLFTLAVLYAALPNTFWRQVAPPLVFTTGLIVLRLTYLTGGPASDIPGDIVILLAMNAVGVLLVRQRHEGEARTTLAWEAETAARQRAEAALAELRILRGIIPICSYCKRVRAETGDWQQVERYVRDHSDAEFSHGICPNCFEAEAPGLDYP
jgi:hypothetical protein